MAWSAPRTWTAGETLTAALLNTELRDNLNAAEPVGELHYYIRSATTVATLINAFALETNGVAVSRTTYAALNTLLNSLGYPFGSGDGSTTMTLPDVQNRGLVAMGSGGHADSNALGDSDALAKTLRVMRHTHLGPSHEHPIDDATVTTANAAMTPGAGVNVAVHDVYDVVGNTGTAGNDVTSATPLPYLVAGVYAVKAF